jgi:hypothetical protein
MFILEPVPASDIEQLAKDGKIQYGQMDTPIGAMRMVTIYRHAKLNSEVVTNILVGYHAPTHLMRVFYIHDSVLASNVHLTYLGDTVTRPSQKIDQSTFGYRLRGKHSRFFNQFSNQYLRTQMTKSIEAAVKECWVEQTTTTAPNN